jgi:anaerobic magnesium-protoporphyrin IX monomethyl ester cyclase
MTRKRVLLLNPPCRELVIRDYYCSKTTKSLYLFEPIDLVMQSGRLAERFEVSFLDAVVDRLPEGECQAKVLALEPDAVVFLTGAVSWPSDFVFLERLKKALGGVPFIGSGDIFLEDGERWLEENPFIDAALLDFTNDDAVSYLTGDDERIENSVIRRGAAVQEIRTARSRRASFEIPIPRRELFFNSKYRFCFSRKPRFATVLTDFGCPYPCTFCVMSGLGWKTRSVDSVVEELRLLWTRGVRELFFIDQTWGLDRERNLELCRRMRAEGLGFGWVAYARADLVDEPTLAAWRAAGCHTLMFGVEFGDARRLTEYRKGLEHEDVRRALRLAQAAGIRTTGTFILGMPEDDRQALERTARLARELPLDFASFNVAVPRHSTGLRARAKERGLIGDLRVMDQSGGRAAAMPTGSLARDEVLRLKRRAVLAFYLRPSYLWRRLRAVESWFDLRSQAAEGLAVLWSAAF